jgi:hypothetical protein
LFNSNVTINATITVTRRWKSLFSQSLNRHQGNFLIQLVTVFTFFESLFGRTFDTNWTQMTTQGVTKSKKVSFIKKVPWVSLFQRNRNHSINFITFASFPSHDFDETEKLRSLHQFRYFWMVRCAGEGVVVNSRVELSVICIAPTHCHTPNQLRWVFMTALHITLNSTSTPSPTHALCCVRRLFSRTCKQFRYRILEIGWNWFLNVEHCGIGWLPYIYQMLEFVTFKLILMRLFCNLRSSTK